MKAVVYTRYGSPEVLSYTDIPLPTPKDHEVRIHVQAASVNSWDWDLLRGKPFLTRLGGFLKPRYAVLGADVAGFVEAVGRKVTQWKPGDAVYGDLSGCGWGGFAQYVCADARVLTRKPANLTFAQAAALPQAGVLAWQGMYANGTPQAGHSILINGAGGGVGTLALQLAQHFKTTVTAVDTTAKLDLAHRLKADHLLDYTQTDFTRIGHTYDLILDVVASSPACRYAKALRPGGRYVVIGGSTRAIFQTLLVGSWRYKSQQKQLGLLLHKPNATDLEKLTNLAETGVLTPVIDKVYGLADTAEALRYFGTGQVQGKLIIQPH